MSFPRRHLFCIQYEQHSLTCASDLQTTQNIYICLTNSFLTATSFHSQTSEQQAHLTQFTLTCFIEQPRALIVTPLEKLKSDYTHPEHSLGHKTLFIAQQWELIYTSLTHDQASCRQQEHLVELPTSPSPNNKHCSPSIPIATQGCQPAPSWYLCTSPLITSVPFTLFCFKFVLLNYRQFHCYSL